MNRGREKSGDLGSMTKITCGCDIACGPGRSCSFSVYLKQYLYDFTAFLPINQRLSLLKLESPSDTLRFNHELTRRHPLLTTKLANDDPRVNCHQWVNVAWRALSHKGYLTAEQYPTGLNEMFDATMRADDEPHAHRALTR